MPTPLTRAALDPNRKPTLIVTSSVDYTTPLAVAGNPNTGSIFLEGPTAAGATAAGNPLQLGGVYNSTLPTLTNGQTGTSQLDSRSQQLINLGVQLDATNDSVNIGKVGGLTVAGLADATTNPSIPYMGDLPFAFNGATWDRLRTPNVFKTVALGAATTETTIWTPTTGKKFRFMGAILTCGAASTLTFNDNTSGTAIIVTRGTTDTPILIMGLGNGILSAAANNVFTVVRGTSCTLSGVVFGTEE